MSKREELHATASSLRLKASQGVLAVMAARDLLAVLPAGLRAAVDAAISSGELKQQWEKELAQASAALPDSEEAVLAAVTAMLAWQQNVAAKVVQKYVEKIEGERKVAEGRAAGIEEALAALAEEPSPDPAPTA